MKPKSSRRNRSARPSRGSRNQDSLDDDLLGDDDADASLYFGGRCPKRKIDRKARQLCAQVADTLSYVLAGECNDDVLRDLLVMAVDPAPDSSQLVVTIRPDAASGEIASEDALARLEAASGKLRAAVAAAITRKRAPKLLFRLLPAPPQERQP